MIVKPAKFRLQLLIPLLSVLELSDLQLVTSPYLKHKFSSLFFNELPGIQPVEDNPKTSRSSRAHQEQC
jgi:hypothetical protein